jgi:sulfur-oxidizing protein SoxY
MHRRGLAILTACTALLVATGAAHAGDYDPMRSALWADMHSEFLGDGPVKYDYQVRLIIPRTVEDAFSVPVVVELSERVQPVQEVVVIAENNPIQTAARMFPRRAIRSVGMNIRLEQSTPVRAAARDADGVWHVASVRVEVMNPGGCTAAGGAGSAENPLGTIAMKRFRRPQSATRLKVRITHPMDTGLVTDADGAVVPAYYVDTVTLSDTAGPIADLVTSAALATNPNFYFDLPDRLQTVRVTASDSKGLTFNLLEPVRRDPGGQG